MPYDKYQIARELDATAQGHAYFGNALRVAKDIPGLTDDDRAVLDRYATGQQIGTDHIRLQDVATKVRSERVRLRRDTHFVDGTLKAQAGAIGSVIGHDQGMLTIHFDDGEHFVALDGSGLRIAHNVPRLAVDTLI